jgi:2-oxoglutarate ferredoxin oxidoreductase subunit alpha
MQLTGDRFTSETAAFGNDLSTLPNFPAEIRAPAGTLPGRLLVPGALRRPRHPDAGDAPDVLVAMNPAALKANLATCRAARPSSSTATIHAPEPAKVGLRANPLEDGSSTPTPSTRSTSRS